MQNRMRSSLRLYMGDAVVAYEEKPREQWLFDYPAQVSLCGTQIWWSTEVNIAFSRLEEVILKPGGDPFLVLVKDNFNFKKQQTGIR